MTSFSCSQFLEILSFVLDAQVGQSSRSLSFMHSVLMCFAPSLPLFEHDNAAVVPGLDHNAVVMP